VPVGKGKKNRDVRIRKKKREEKKDRWTFPRAYTQLQKTAGTCL
jgi:hypothetical protein